MVTDIVATARVIAHDVLPEQLQRMLVTPMRYPLLAGTAGVTVAGAALAASLVHLAFTVAGSAYRPVVLTVLCVLLAAGPAIRLSVGSTPVLVASVGAVAPLLHALDLGRVRRACQALAAFVPVAAATCVVGAAAVGSLTLAGEHAAAGAALVAALVGTLTAGALAALRSGRPLITGLVGRTIVVLCGGVTAFVVLATIGPQVQLLDALPVPDANTARSLVMALAISPALWLATEVLVRDARAPLRLARELTSCGASAMGMAIVVGGSLAGAALLSLPAALGITLLAGMPDEWLTAAVVAGYVVVIAGLVVLLEPQREHVVARATLFVVLLAPGAMAIGQAESAAAVFVAAPIALVLVLVIAIGRMR